MADILIRNGIVVPMTGHKVLKETSIVVDEGRIIAIGPDKVIRREYSSDIEIDASNHIVIPGLINTHTHLAMTLFRGIMDGVSGMEWLNRAWSIESNLTSDDVYWGSMLGCLEMIKSGTTCFADHYFFMDAVVDAVKSFSIRAALAQAIIEEGGPTGIDTTLEGSLKFAKHYHGEANGRITCMLGPHSAYTCSPDLLKKVKELSEETGLRVHIHLSEGRSELKIVKEKYKTTPIRLLKHIGLLNPKLLAAHVVFVDEEEIELLKECRVNVNHNPICKMKGGHGISPVSKMLRKGINVSLGTDGAGSNNNLDLLEEMKFAALLQPLAEQDPKAISAWDVLEMSTIRGARALGIENEVGSIEVGKKADLVLLRRKVPHMIPFHNIPSLIVYSANGNDVNTVIIDGKILMRNREVLTVKEGDVMREAQRTFERLLDRSGWEPIMEGIPIRV